MTITDEDNMESWRHDCEEPGCTRTVIYWDEPYCFTHSPDEGSSFRNYDSRQGGWLRA